ncbi:MAG: glutamine amidotransferase-related protein [Bacteriovoracaceae bacterium]
MRQCYLFDYEDSFTHNIASELRMLEFNVLVIPFSEIKNFLTNFETTKEKVVFIHGPGPGHPEDYRDLFPAIKKSFLLKNVYQVGLCLGHQIFCTLWGGKVERSNHPMHGQRVEMEIPLWSVFPPKFQGKKIQVQRYNSLSLLSKKKKLFRNSPTDLKLAWQDNELFLTSSSQFLTYQFHPESVGTSYRSLFFKPLEKFLL